MKGKEAKMAQPSSPGRLEQANYSQEVKRERRDEQLPRENEFNFTHDALEVKVRHTMECPVLKDIP